MAQTMYPLKPVFDLDAKVDVPTCMYSLPIIQSSTPIEGIGMTKATCPLSVEALEARQDAILARLGQLKDQVAAYKQSLGLPDIATPTTATPAFPTITASDTTTQRIEKLKRTMLLIEAIFLEKPTSKSTHRETEPSSRIVLANVTKTADIVIRCSPSFPAFSLKGIYSLLTGSGLKVHTSCHTHCSVSSLPPNVQSFLPVTEVPRSTAQVRITLIWTELDKECELMVSPLAQTVIKGETNILRYFSRLFPTILPYESLPNLMSVDNMLDSVSSLLWAVPREKQPIMRSLAVNLAKTTFLAGQSVCVADLALYSVIRQLGLDKDLQPELMKWYLTMAKQLEGKSSRNRNRNSSMRKSVSSSSPKKADSHRRTSEKEKSPKKEVKKGKSPTKEVKIEKNPPTKSGKQKKVSAPLDLESGDAVGAIFTKQWPEIKHVFQSQKLKTYLDEKVTGLVAEKFDGSNLAVTSNGVISSRRNILLKDPTAEQLEKFKFSGVSLSKLLGVFDKVASLRKHFQDLFPFLEVEAIVYGELIQKGTATCKEDKFNYRPRGIDQGEFHVFGGGLAFTETLDNSAIESALVHLRKHGFSVISNKNEFTEKSHLVILMNGNFAEALNICGFENVISHKAMTLNETLDVFTKILMKNEIEGIVVNFGDEILKWKGLEESYPDMFLDQIKELKYVVDPIVLNAFLKVAHKAREDRVSLKKDKATEILLEKAYNSAITKVRSLEDLLAEGESQDKVISNFEKVLKEEMMKDCHSSKDYEEKLTPFIKSKIKIT